MTTYAQTYDGYAQNIVIGDSFDEAVNGVYSPDWVQKEIDAKRPWSEVPDGTKPNAKSDGNGGWINPTPAPPTPKPVALTKSEFQTLYADNGADITKTLAAWPTA